MEEVIGSTTMKCTWASSVYRVRGAFLGTMDLFTPPSLFPMTTLSSGAEKQERQKIEKPRVSLGMS